MNRHKLFWGRRTESLISATMMILAVAVERTCAQQTNAPARSDYSYFKLIEDRNIFDSSRSPRRSRRGASQQGPEMDAFSLVGTMSYGKGTFAFFDGTSSDYRKALEVNGTIAGYKVKEITPNAVKLESDGGPVQLKVTNQMRHEEKGGWRLVAPEESPVELSAPAISDASASESSSAGEVNDVLKKLMQQREQESK